MPRVWRLARIPLVLVAVAICGCDSPAPSASGIVPLSHPEPEPAAGIQSADDNAAPSFGFPSLAGLGFPPYPSTPQEVFERSRAAAASNEWHEYVTYLSPESIDRNYAAYMESAVVWDESSFARTGNPRLQELASRMSGPMQALFDALEARGITRAMLAEAKFNPVAKTRLLASIPDKAAFIADVMMAGGGNFSGKLQSNSHEENWQVQGELATVDLVAERNGHELRFQMEFKKIDGRWKLEM